MFLGLSLFVTYRASSATDFREFLRQAQAGIFDRLDRASSMVTDFELLDLASPTRRCSARPQAQSKLAGWRGCYGPRGWRVGFRLWRNDTALVIDPTRDMAEQTGPSGAAAASSASYTGIQFRRGHQRAGPGSVLGGFYINFGIPVVLIGFLGLGLSLDATRPRHHALACLERYARGIIARNAGADAVAARRQFARDPCGVRCGLCGCCASSSG